MIETKRRPRPYELIPEALLALGLGVFAITEPHAAMSAFKSSRAVALMAIVAVAWVGCRLVSLRLLHWPIATTAAFAIGALVILKIVVLPAYRDHTVIESAPGARAPTVLRTGSFRGIDHRARGTVQLGRESSGDFVVALVDFDIQPGPNYDLYLVPGADRTHRSHAVRVDDLRGNRGTQYYNVPARADVEHGPWTVLVWCQTFSVPVANSTPT